MTATLMRSGYLALRNILVIVSGQIESRKDAIAAYTIDWSWSAAVPTGGHGLGAAGSMSSRSTILNHLPSWGPTQTQGSRCGAGSVHFRSSGSQSGPMPACASAASASSHFMLLQQSLRDRAASCRLRDVAASHARQRSRLWQSWNSCDDAASHRSRSASSQRVLARARSMSSAPAQP